MPNDMKRQFQLNNCNDLQHKIIKRQYCARKNLCVCRNEIELKSYLKHTLPTKINAFENILCVCVCIYS